MLFVKYISDVWRDHYDTLLARYDGDEARSRRMMRQETHPAPGCNYQSLYEQRNAPNLGQISKRREGILPPIIPVDTPLILQSCRVRNAEK